MNTKRNENDYVIIYKLKGGLFRIYDCYDNTFKTGKFPMDRIHFFKLKSDKFAKDDEGLRLYADQFKIWCDELKKATTTKKGKVLIDYAECLSDFHNVSRIFNWFCKKHYKNHEQITRTEYKWFELASNGALQYLRENDITIQSYGYDYNKYYGRNMGAKDLFIPTTEGKETFLKELKNDFMRKGFYRVKITCENNEFRKMFTYNRNDIYLDSDIKFVNKYKDEFNINIELIIDDKPNALLYYNTISLNKITNEWYEYMMDLNAQFPKNKLLKFMISTCWGMISQTNTINKTEQEIEDEEIDIGHPDRHEYSTINEVTNTHTSYYELINNWQPYKYNLRLKPFLSAYGRHKMGHMAHPHLKHLIRVHTDNLTFDKPIEFNDPLFLSEDKTTGLIYWKHNGEYEKV